MRNEGTLLGNITINFFFNLSLIILLFFLFFSVFRKPENLFRQKKLLLLYFSLSIIFCFVFSYKVSESLLLNLRSVPLIVGGLYFGFSPFLGFLVISLRGFYGIDLGFFESILSYGILSSILYCHSLKFLSQKSSHRIFYAFVVSLGFSIIDLSTLMLVTDLTNNTDVLFAYIVIPPISVATLSFIIEVLQKNYYFHQELVKSEKAAAIEQMGAAITHEIRNPLTTAMGFVELLDQAGLSSKKRNQYLSILKDELDSAERIIQGYLTYSKPITESTSRFHVNEELYRVIQLLKPLANYHSVKIIDNFTSTKIMEGDRSKFQQSFLNIGKCVIESMTSGGALIIETADIDGEIIVLLQNSRTADTLNFQDLSMTIAFEMIHSLKGTIHIRNDNGKKFSLYISFKPVKCHLLHK